MGDCLSLSCRHVYCAVHIVNGFLSSPGNSLEVSKAAVDRRWSTQHPLLEASSHILNQEKDDKGLIQVEVTRLPTKSQGAGRGESGSNVIVEVKRFLF